MREVKEMPEAIQGLARAAVGGSPGGGRSDVKPETVFIQAAVFSELPNSVRLDATPYGGWVMVSNAEFEEAEQELVEAGWHFSADGLIEASAFGCDSKVLERAVSRALQKAADDELDVLEITRMTLQQNSGLDYVSIFARSRTIRRNPYWTPSAME